MLFFIEDSPSLEYNLKLGAAFRLKLELTKVMDYMDLNNGSGAEKWIEQYDFASFCGDGNIFDSEYFINNYTYDGRDLGAVLDGDKTVFKLWAPTAEKVVLNLYDNGSYKNAYKTVDMERLERGVWAATAECGHGTYYTYTVTTAFGENEAVDPYAKAVGINGKRGMVVDLSLTNPDGFENDTFADNISRYSDAVIWETHVRDFSNKIKDSKYKGKFLAFTEEGLKNSSGFPVGIDYLSSLGVSHVQLLPIFDYATVDETKSGLFNWGYDPENYNSPEGSYSTDPYNGGVRIKELKALVQALHKAGIGVVMDVVYNHTYSLDESSFNKIVPYYYYRYNNDGNPSNGSGCGNETASNRLMYRRFMIDSILYWAKEYHIDGFRFDLMAIHDLETISEIEKALHRINPKCIIYGEGWSGGCVSFEAWLLASQSNIKRIQNSGDSCGSVAVFNDVIRDGLKGSAFSNLAKGYINGNVSKETADKVAFGISGGVASSASFWSVNDNMVINYMSAHDNNTLWDKLKLSNPELSDNELCKMNRLGAAILMISQGTVFMLSGEEILRSKKGDGNSYRSSDEINNIDWESVKENNAEGKMFSWYSNLIEMRKRYSWIRRADVKTAVWDNLSICAVYTVDGMTAGVAIVNPLKETFLGTLPEGKWNVILDGIEFKWGCETVSKCVSVPSEGVIVLEWAESC